ncbi:RCC1 domain-containing protein [Bacillus sp. Brlt_9]|uniref:RCC1 domain-containing protein n=1 Tax=Bacillus sp. Brlt_9 TaxID=3110916 RepID=UPI003F7CACBF
MFKLITLNVASLCLINPPLSPLSNINNNDLPNTLIKSELINAQELPLDAVQMTGGLGFTAILKEDGSVWTWGRNDYGQLGLNDTIDRSSPTRLNSSLFNNEKIKQIEAYSIGVIARTEKGKIYHWGYRTLKPSLIYNDPLIIDIEASGKSDNAPYPSMQIVTNEGMVRSSGSNVFSAFGIGTSSWFSALGNCKNVTTTSFSDFSYFAYEDVKIESCESNNLYKKPIEGSIKPLINIIDISVAPNRRGVLGLKKSNELYVWGENYSDIPKKLPGADKYQISKIAMSKYPTFLNDEGKLYCYPNINQEPVEIKLEGSNEKIIDIKSGADFLLVLTSNSKLYGIGTNTYGNLGPKIPKAGTPFETPLATFTGIENVKRIGAGAEHSIIQFNDLRFATFGRNSYGELATTDINSKHIFTKNENLTNVTNIQSINFSSFASTSDNKLHSWGGREIKETLNRPGDRNIPKIVKDFSGRATIKELNGSTRDYIHGGVLLDNGEFWNFGENWKRGLGSDAPYNSVSQPVKNLNSTLLDRNFHFTSASQGYFHGIALSQDNKIYTWGYDAGLGMLGIGEILYEINNGTREPGWRYAFEEPILPKNETFKKVYSGVYENLILTTEGKIYAWGGTPIRYGMTSNTSIPKLVNNLPPIKEIAMGLDFNLYLDYEGNVWAAGYNSYGQLGIGNTSTPPIPTKINNLPKIKTIGAGMNSSYAITTNGELYSWGDNRYGQLGLDDLIQRNEPRKVPNATTVKQVNGGQMHAMFINESGNLFVTGSDGEGQLGLGQPQYNPNPIIVVFPPIVSIFNSNNQDFTTNDNLAITGEVFTETPGVPISLTYEIESKKGKQTGLIKEFNSKLIPEPFQMNIKLDGTYELGAYTLRIIAKNETGVKGENFFNFSVTDKINPTINVDINSTPQWKLDPVNIKVSSDDTGGSGYRGFRYAITNTTSIPNNWSAIIEKKQESLKIDTNGLAYLHLEAFDNIGNKTYLMTGPYYLDLYPPNIEIQEPPKWQQDYLSLLVTVQDISNITLKKWKFGNVTKDEIIKTGNNFENNHININNNGSYTIYAKDENNQESLKTFTVSNLNHQPLLHNSTSDILIPINSKDTFEVHTTLTHTDIGDPTLAEIKLNNETLSSTNTNSDKNEKSNVVWKFTTPKLTENTIHSGEILLKDSKNGISNSNKINLEIFNPKFILKNKLSSIHLSWEHSILFQEYRLLKNGKIIYSGTNNYFVENNIELDRSTNKYELEVKAKDKYIKVASSDKETGFYQLDTPSSISFPSTILGKNEELSPTQIDKEFIKYEDFSDLPSPYSLNVSITNFKTKNSSFTPESFLLKNVSKLNRQDKVVEKLGDILLRATPTEIISSKANDSASYFKLEVLKNNISLKLPRNILLEQNGNNNFSSTIIWDLQLTP